MLRVKMRGWRAGWLTALLLLGLQSTVDAQALLVILFGDKLSTEKFQLGINADIVWSGYTGVGSYEPRFSWAFGAYGEINLGKHWHLQPELTIKTPGGAKGMDVSTPGPFEEPTGDATLDSMLPWVGKELEDTRELMGDNYWPYGIDANRKVLEALFQYSYEQGLASRQLTIEELFHSTTLELRDTPR